MILYHCNKLSVMSLTYQALWHIFENHISEMECSNLNWCTSYPD